MLALISALLLVALAASCNNARAEAQPPRTIHGIATQPIIIDEVSRCQRVIAEETGPINQMWRGDHKVGSKVFNDVCCVQFEGGHVRASELVALDYSRDQFGENTTADYASVVVMREYPLEQDLPAGSLDNIAPQREVVQVNIYASSSDGDYARVLAAIYKTRDWDPSTVIALHP